MTCLQHFIVFTGLRLKNTTCLQQFTVVTGLCPKTILRKVSLLSILDYAM